MKKRFVLFFCCFFLFANSSILIAQNVKTTAEVRAHEAVVSHNLLLQGYEAYRNSDWATALFFFRKAVSSPEQATEETWFMLIMSEMYSAQYENAIHDGDLFCSWYPNSEYVPNVQYQIGRAKHLIGDNDKAVLLLSEFCHQYPSHSLYPSALFWIAECFYQEYNFTVAKSLYERIVSDYYENQKAIDAQYRIETIAQREREEKLLYLLKVTGEEYLAAQEDYEKQLKEYQTEELLDLRKQLKDLSNNEIELKTALEEAREKSEQLEKSLIDLQDKTVQNIVTEKSVLPVAPTQPTIQPEMQPEVVAVVPEDTPKTSSDLELLKQKAKEVQSLYDKKKSQIDKENAERAAAAAKAEEERLLAEKAAAAKAEEEKANTQTKK